MGLPLVSVIIPTYNRVSLIGETLDSILAQTYENWECIVIDDGSTDDTKELLEKYKGKDNRIKISQRDRLPKGAPTCRNIGLNIAAGDLIIFLDSDDVIAPFCVSQRVSLFLSNPQMDFLVFKSLLFDKKPSDAKYYWNIDTEEDDIIRFLKLDAIWQTSGPIYKRKYLINLGGFREGMLFWQDFDLHLRGLLSGGTYVKYFDFPPDIFIRTGRNDTISRNISLVGNKDILQIRIDYYCFIRSFIQMSIYRNNKAKIRTIDSILFFLCAQYLIKHSNLFLFITRWAKTFNYTSLSVWSSYISVLYIILLKLSNRIPKLKSVLSWLDSKYGNKIPDYYVMNNNKVTIVPV